VRSRGAAALEPLLCFSVPPILLESTIYVMARTVTAKAGSTILMAMPPAIDDAPCLSFEQRAPHEERFYLYAAIYGACRTEIVISGTSASLPEQRHGVGVRLAGTEGVQRQVKERLVRIRSGKQRH
jgi:hypothetical protein